jgi:hypothetical protein
MPRNPDEKKYPVFDPNKRRVIAGIVVVCAAVAAAGLLVTAIVIALGY